MTRPISLFDASLRVHRLPAWIVVAYFVGHINIAWAQQNTIQSITSTEENNRTVLRIVMEKPVSIPPFHFAITNPDRIALDFLDTSNGTGRLIHEPNLANLPTYTVAQSGRRIRMVLNIQSPSTYTTAVDNNTVIVNISKIVQPDPVVVAPIAPPPASTMIRTVDFHHGTGGQGHIIINLSDNKLPIHVRQEGTTLIADFLGANLIKKTHSLLEVQQFNTPVQAINIAQNGKNVRMTVTNKGLWTYQAFQTDSRLAIDIEPTPEPIIQVALTAPPTTVKRERDNPAVKGKTTDADNTQHAAKALNAQKYKGAPLSFNFQNIEVRTILQVIADFTGLNIIASDTVRGTLTMRLKEVPWDQALDIVMQSRGLDVRQNGSVLWVAPKEELLNKEKMELEQRALIRSLEPLHAEVFQLNYQKVDEFRKSFGINEDGSIDPTRKNTVLSARGSAVIDKRTNQIFVTDTEFVMTHIRTLIKKIDIPSKQVLIEARIVEADDKFSRNLGTRLGFSAKNESMAIGNSYAHVGQLVDPTAISDATNSPAINLPALSTGGNTANFAVSLFNSAANRFLNLELSALEADGYGKILSSPRVVTADQQAALIEQGEELPYQQATSSGATSTAFRKANLKLEVTPQITPDGNVILTVDVNKDSRGDSTPDGLAINTKHVKTQVQVENGGTVVIGGIYTQTDIASTSRIPWLGSLPFIGFLFRNTQQINDKTELLIFLTPKVISDNKLSN